RRGPRDIPIRQHGPVLRRDRREPCDGPPRRRRILPPVDRRADRRPPGRSERGPRRPGAEGGGAEAASRSEAVLRAATPRGTLRGGGTRRRSGGSWRWCRYPCPEPPQAFPGGPVDPGSAVFLAEAFEEPDRLLGLARARQRLGLVEPLLAGGQR